ncbi:protein canopy homolog 1-like isoform X2 [Bradysia coprophila]|uniref:protein canopy homolog 1-like isoform X1 n=1 Tax=Bradysia coprophila TaxID=38358 RepID=UPI00187DA064|nr:protein canopy homolog 1-like isoform X1 [Bradysia coprophila]XP_037035136.1 protein canopy homolog 1-like isoform X2 [Bradysia coprophila]
MKRAVILCLSVLISLVLLVKCDDEGTLNANDVGNSNGNNEGADGGLLKHYESEESKLILKCFVCRSIIDTMLYEIKKVNPRKRIEVSATKSILYSKSESYLAELMEDLCEYQDTFATLRQVLVQKTFIQSMLDNNGSVDATPGFSQESLSTENVNFLCLDILGEHDDAILAEFKKEVLSENIDEIICTETAKYCVKKETEVNNERDEL